MNVQSCFLEGSFYKILFPKPKDCVDETNHKWDLYQRTNKYYLF
jgi:hypothetical protein